MDTILFERCVQVMIAYMYISQHASYLTQLHQAWEKSTVKDWCLSEACLTVQKAQSALNEYLCDDLALRDEIQVQCGKIEGLSDEGTSAEAQINDFSNDDTDIPLNQVILDAVGLALPALPEVNGNYKFTVESVTKDCGVKWALEIRATGDDWDSIKIRLSTEFHKKKLQFLTSLCHASRQAMTLQ